MKNRINTFLTVLQIILGTTALFLIVKILIWSKNSSYDKYEHDKLLNEVIIYTYNENNIDQTENIQNKIDQTENIQNKIDNENIKNNEITIDFDKLKSINNEIIGWIKIDSTNINYPILKSNNNDYYLYRNFKKEYSQSGSIFLNSYNNMFFDKNTIIYGHNMNDNSMFHDLFKIYDNILGNDITINIYTNSEDMKYKVISSYIDTPENISYNYDFDTLINRSNIKYSFADINIEKILTLYTCNLWGDKRLIIHAAKIID